MPKPPETPPSSDIDGVNKDARVNTPDKEHPDPGGAIENAREQSTGRPKATEPLE